jgi:Flp pilus assembly protein TadD
MKRRLMLSIGAAVFAVGGTAVSGMLSQGHAFAAGATNAKKAAAEAKAARKAIAGRDADKAVRHAEAAVANDPRSAEYRAMLGQAYLLAGRFTSAGQALRDALALNPENGRAALNLVLASIAQGDWGVARALLQTHADQIPASDRGLAYALAGDPVTAVDILSAAAREPTATAKTRQNLALSLALAGRWGDAKTVASADVAPDQLNARLLKWVAFARPTNAYEQVATLLGVRAVEDAGQPVVLALARQPAVALAAAPAPAPVSQPEDSYLPEPADLSSAPAPEPASTAPVAVAVAEPALVFAPRNEIVQPLPVRRTAEAPRAAVAARAPAEPHAPPARASGKFVVQLGAFTNADVARDSWARIARRVPALQGQAPQGASVSTRAGSFYRLSVGGFARRDADALCRSLRTSGARCFVRVQAGDAAARWYRPGGNQVAAR